MADLLAPGIWWLHGTRGSNVYLVEADDGSLALIDTGFASSAAAICRELKQLGRPLSAILLTHMHLDHSGAAGEVRRRTGARLVVGRADCHEQDGSFFLRTLPGRSHVARFLLGRAQHPRTIRIDQVLEGRCEVLPGIMAVPVPGHTPGSYCYVVSRANASFVGDIVISHGGTLTRSMRRANHDDREYLDSIRTFAGLATSSGFPGHGQPIIEGFDASLAALAALPRLRPNPVRIVRRQVRLLRFGHGMLTRRH